MMIELFEIGYLEMLKMADHVISNIVRCDLFIPNIITKIVFIAISFNGGIKLYG